MEINIQIEWRSSSAGEIRPEHRDALVETAAERVCSGILQGFVCGELTDNIYMLDDDPEEGVDYRGWWSMSIRDPD